MSASQLWTDLTSMSISAPEKVLRTVAVYLVLAILIRLAGKRTLAQLNNFDLVVVLLLSNVVQNAVIGPDNSLTGGLLGAAVLMAFNAGYVRLATATAWTRWFFEGSETTLVRDGVMDRRALVRLGLRPAEVTATLRHQGADDLSEVSSATLAPGGAVTVELERADQAASYGELVEEIRSLRAHLDARLPS